MYKLIEGDCIEVMKRIPNASIDCILADPPYGVTACKWDAIIPLDLMWGQLSRVIKPKGAIIFTTSQPFSSVLVMSNIKMFKHEWVWIKNRGSNFANTVREPMKEHETILVFSNGGWVYNKQMQERTGAGLNRTKYDCDFITSSDNYSKFNGRESNKLSKLRVPSSWQKFNTVSGKEKTKHPTQKPVALMEYLVKTYTNKKGLILDFTMGSGSTGVACVKLNRHFLGIENNREYFLTAEKRMNTLV